MPEGTVAHSSSNYGAWRNKGPGNLPSLTIKLSLGWATGEDNGTCDLGCGGEDTAIKEFSLQMCPWGFRME